MTESEFTDLVDAGYEHWTYCGEGSIMGAVYEYAADEGIKITPADDERLFDAIRSKIGDK